MGFPMSIPDRTCPKVFISYSHLTDYIGNQLYCDLKRMGFDPFLDRFSIRTSHDWSKEIEDGLRSSQYFVLLFSREADESEYVKKEVDLAFELLKNDKVILLCAGLEEPNSGYLSGKQFFERKPYWDTLADLSEHLGLKAPPDSTEQFMQTRGRKAGELHDLFKKNSPRLATTTYSPKDDHSGRNGIEIVSVPWRVSAYSGAWLIMDRDADFVLDCELHVVFNFTGDDERRAADDVMQYLLYGNPDYEIRRRHPQLVLIQGPRDQKQRSKNEREFYLPNDARHIWQDCIEFTSGVINSLSKHAKLHFYFNAPQALSAAVMRRVTVTSQMCFYNLDQDRDPGSQDRYSPIYEV